MDLHAQTDFMGRRVVTVRVLLHGGATKDVPVIMEEYGVSRGDVLTMESNPEFPELFVTEVVLDGAGRVDFLHAEVMKRCPQCSERYGLKHPLTGCPFAVIETFLDS
jgi:hypothetical protein